MRLLVPMDGSTGAGSALELALWLATRSPHAPPTRAEIEVLHVVAAAEASGRWIDDLAGLFGVEPVLVSKKLAVLLRERGAEIVERSVARCRTADVSASGLCETGPLVETICRRAALADLVVVGLRGESGDRFPTHDAGTTERAIPRIPVSTLVVPAGMHRIKGIALGYDRSEGARRALDATAWIARWANVPVHAFAVDEPEADLAEVARRLDAVGVDVATHHITGDPHAVLPEQAASHGCNVLALGYRGRSQLKDAFLGRTTEWLIGRIDMGILVAR